MSDARYSASGVKVNNEEEHHKKECKYRSIALG